MDTRSRTIWGRYVANPLLLYIHYSSLSKIHINGVAWHIMSPPTRGKGSRDSEADVPACSDLSAQWYCRKDPPVHHDRLTSPIETFFLQGSGPQPMCGKPKETPSNQEGRTPRSPQVGVLASIVNNNADVGGKPFSLWVLQTISIHSK